MKIKRIFQILILSLVLFSSCVTNKSASTIQKAEKKIAYFNEGINNQIKEYPSLVKESFTTTKYDTIFIKGDEAKLNLLYQNIELLDSLNKQSEKISLKQRKYIDSLESINYFQYDSTGKLGRTVISLTQKIRGLIKENELLKEQIAREIELEVQGTYKDSTFVVDYLFKDGILDLNIKVNDKYKVVPVSVTTNKVKATTRFYQDIRFYGFLIVLFNLIYFFGAQLQSLLKRFISFILGFIRKLIFKV